MEPRMSDIKNISERKDIIVRIPDICDTHTGSDDDASSDLESFDEDDMYASDYGDDVICVSPDTTPTTSLHMEPRMSDIKNISGRKNIIVRILDVCDTHTESDDDASSDLESFDEDDMYASDYGDDVICDSPDTNEESPELERSLRRFENVMAESRSLYAGFENIYTLARMLYDREYASEHDDEGAGASGLSALLNRNMTQLSHSDDILFAILGLDRPPDPPTYIRTLKGIPVFKMPFTSHNWRDIPLHHLCTHLVFTPGPGSQMPRSRDVIVPDIVDGIEEVVIKHTKTKRGTIRTTEKVVPVVRPQKERSGQPSRPRKKGTQPQHHAENANTSGTAIRTPDSEDPHMHLYTDEQQPEYPLQDTTEDCLPRPSSRAATIPTYSIGDGSSGKI
ncbi:hypothetical protein EDB84DRAFT_1445140 [Lactarius hengduanensis]|nr:hypothetical protein EDB84DRAFT_1445140 [Lactarius hengduanensis]